ncbi:catalase [Niveibacterium sp. SC-1]|uniref:catalase n=1 Tax=Niveibacterium sp. SC-1 TaxID=3135646 RepID=UPI00311DB78D
MKKPQPNPIETAGGETHQTNPGKHGCPLTTNVGIPVADNQNSLRQGARGPTLLEDFVLREKITHFDHERIPERIVHARGSGAHGYFQVYESQAAITQAAFLQDPSVKTPVFARFSTVAGGAGSGDMPRDVRGFAVKFYTEEGNFDLVGNNIPVFFIQDAMKFPDLVHAVKMEPDRGFPQAASAHDTFWDFVSLMPESMHMLMWAMSDRAIPRSLRMMQGFGVHTFRMRNAEGAWQFVKFHWRPLHGSASVVWDEAVKLNGADPDFHRRDLWEAIERGVFPEFELSLQVFDEAFADSLPYDVLDATKLIPEELIPLQPIGRMVLDRNPDNFFAETEQVAFCPANIVPGIDFSEDPLLQGRLFSYLDTQLSRLGGPNFNQIPVNAPRCPMHNFQRDGLRQMAVPKGRVAYEPNSLDEGQGPREDPQRGFQSLPIPAQGDKVRERAESFADHYSQPRLFWNSMSAPEQAHIVSAFAFELGKVDTRAIRKRMLGHLELIHADLGRRVASALGMEGEAESVKPARMPLDLAPSPALSLIAGAQETLHGRKVGVLLSEGADTDLLGKLKVLLEAEGAQMVLIGPRAGKVLAADGSHLIPDFALAAAPSIFFDAVVLMPREAEVAAMAQLAAVIDWIRDAYGHLKVIGHLPAAQPLLDKAAIAPDAGVLPITGADALRDFVARAKAGRIWAREPQIRAPV